MYVLLDGKEVRMFTRSEIVRLDNRIIANFVHIKILFN